MLDVDGTLAGCGALKSLDSSHAEIKSMRTAPSYQRRGVASLLLQHIICEAQRMGYSRLSLETGSFDFFEPARGLYAKYGFERCGPFGDYKEDPHNVFMTKVLRDGGSCAWSSHGAANCTRSLSRRRTSSASGASSSENRAWACCQWWRACW